MSCYRSICSGRLNVPPLQPTPFSNQHQLSLTIWAGLPVGGFLHQFETRLNSSWRSAQFIKWYAVLINVVEACFAINELTERKRNGTSGTGNAMGGGRLRSISRNMHFIIEMVMLQTNGLAIYGLLKPNTVLLVPYIVLHVVTLLLELNYFITRTALGWTWNRQPTSSANSTSSWKPKRGTTSLSMLVFVAFNLLIMIGAKFAATFHPAS
ncbi:uncharacterized protein LOC110678786 [Aedes aegypti]|uniref:Uncharacterized protein n=1 Tax=Aedes aegypti TaxID=7159 RepID=A0A6I8U1G7_AEDAE|nr:uncharacterized protein LOC110678786 [Aedes aegypti]